MKAIVIASPPSGRSNPQSSLLPPVSHVAHRRLPRLLRSLAMTARHCEPAQRARQSMVLTAISRHAAIYTPSTHPTILFIDNTQISRHITTLSFK